MYLPRISQARALRMHKRADLTGDGLVDFNEFIRYLQPLTHPASHAA